MSEKNMWQFEEELFAEGYKLICGVDEAGRGPLAGPVCAAAVILPPNLEIPGLHRRLSPDIQLPKLQFFSFPVVILDQLQKNLSGDTLFG